MNIEIDFAYKSFKWLNNAKGNAGVTVIIVGLRNISQEKKYLFDINEQKQEVKNINAYLMNAEDVLIEGRSVPISNFPKTTVGNMPADNGYLLFTEVEKNDFIKKEKNSEKFFKELISAKESLNGEKRFCLWLYGIWIEEIQQFSLIWERVEKVRKFRLSAKKPIWFENPHLFTRISQDLQQDFIAFPRHFSEHRKYIPLQFYSKDFIANDSMLLLPTNDIWFFGVFASRMHLNWISAIGSKIKKDYRYSSRICYNTFPFPQISALQYADIEVLVFDILDIREYHSPATLAELYDPDKMPDDLAEAHQKLDLYIESCYRKKPFESDEERLAYLFDMYSEMSKKAK